MSIPPEYKLDEMIAQEKKRILKLSNAPNIVQLVSHHHYTHKLCRSRFLSIDPLQPKRTGNGWPGYDENKTVGANLRNLYGRLPDVLIAYKPLEHLDFAKVPCFKVLHYNEVKEARFKPEVRESKPDICIFHHYNGYLNQRERLAGWGIQSCHIPHVADPSIFKNWGLPKRWDVMLVGSLSGRVYPLRSRFKDVLRIMRANKYRCIHFEHPGNLLDDADNNWHLVQFAQAVNQARITCFCSSIYKYRLQKFVEVPACNTAIAADQPICEPGEVVPMITCDISETAEHIADKLSLLLDLGHDEVSACNGMQYAAKYTPDYYCERLIKELEGKASPCVEARSG